MRYGMPYRGSKNQIAKWVIENLPKKENLYDLFGGGGAITHCACESGKYTQIYYNDCNQLVVKAFDMAIHGKFRNENRWISHDEFMEKRRTDPYVAFCFSFGNNLRSYAYNKENEVIKQEIHKNYFENNIDIPKEIKLQSL
ncbi:MAG: DNA adenine methylase, partial [Lachnospiraceae bacterium]|nr:DNA adenine methylase [Lachnospiraceae bacterium]